jgi:hypothetical protein
MPGTGELFTLCLSSVSIIVEALRENQSRLYGREAEEADSGTPGTSQGSQTVVCLPAAAA